MLHNLSATFQHSRFHQILTLMQTAKDEVASISVIVRNSIGGQAFAANVSDGFPSQAENTSWLLRYGGYAMDRSEGVCSDFSCTSHNDLGRSNKCFGCQGPHPHMKNKVIVCPNKGKPGVHEAAEIAYKEWTTRMKKQFKKRKDKLISYNKLSDKDKAKMRSSVFASLCTGALADEVSTVAANLPTGPLIPFLQACQGDDPGH
jgi:hypothetical protein